MNTPILSRETAGIDFNELATNANWRELSEFECDSNINFDVDCVPLHTLTNLPDNGEQAVVRVSDQRILKVHGSDYTLLRNKTAFSTVDQVFDMLVSSGRLNMDDVYINSSCVNLGGKAIVDYIFPHHFIDIDGQTVFMKVTVINSYDGSSNFSLKVSGFRVMCLNGLVTNEQFQSVCKRHSGEFSMGDLKTLLARGIAGFTEMGKEWHKMTTTGISRKQVDAILTSISMDKSSNKVSLTKFNMLDEIYQNHASSLGKNYWALYNTLTAYSTHYTVQDRNALNRKNVILRREKEVAKVMDSKLWEVC